MVSFMPGPWNMLIHSEVDGMGHNYQYSCATYTIGDVGDDMGDFTLLCKDGSPIPADTAVQTLVALLQPVYSTDVTFVDASLWKYRVGTYEMDWYSALTLGVVGTATPPYHPAEEIIWTFRTQANHQLRFTFEETVAGGNLRTALSLQVGDWADIRDYLVSDANWILARDGTYPIVPMMSCMGQNEAVWRKRFRS